VSILALTVMANARAAEQVQFTRLLDDSERRCLGEILRNGHWRRTSQFHPEMLAVAVAAEVELKKDGRKEYIFVMADSSFCGTAGCSMLIGEDQGNGSCRELFDGSGFTHAIAVLNARDHGYRRLYTPCELRFNGHQYQQLHEECPTLDVQR